MVVNWGDGTPAETLTAANLTAMGSPTGVVFSISDAHTYAEEGTFAITIVVTDDGGSETVISSSAKIGDAALAASATQPTVSTHEATVFPIPQFGAPVFRGDVASFVDANAGAPIADFTATIDWGDGTPISAGTILAGPPGSPAGTFVVDGAHTYADAGVNGGVGTYPIQVFVQDVGGSRLTIANTANVADEAIVVTGKLNPASDSGVSNSDDVTNVRQPDFFGSSEPFSHVTLFATPIGGGTPIQIGQVQAGGDGSWNITSNVPLTDGHYDITASAVDQFGVTTTVAPVTITADLLIDTTAPRITGMFFNRLNGQIDFSITDASPASGVNLSTLLDSANYNFTKVHPQKAYPGKYLVTNISAVPGSAANTYDVVVTINSGKPIRGGFYLFTIKGTSIAAAGVQDIAGNELDGEFYGSFPSGNGIPGGDFIAELSGIHAKIFAPQTIVGTANPSNGGVGGAPVGAVHSGDFTPVVPIGGGSVFAEKKAEAAAKAKAEAAAKQIKIAAVKAHAAAAHKAVVAKHPKGPHSK